MAALRISVARSAGGRRERLALPAGADVLLADVLLADVFLGNGAMSVRQAKDALGNNVQLDFVRAAGDRNSLRFQPEPAHADFPGAEVVTLPAEALGAADTQCISSSALTNSASTYLKMDVAAPGVLASDSATVRCWVSR